MGMAFAEKVQSHQDAKRRQIGLLLGLIDQNLVNLGYEHMEVSLGYNASVDDACHLEALKNLSVALGNINILHFDYTNLDSITIVPSRPLPAYGTTGKTIQLIDNPFPLGKTLFIPCHIKAQAIEGKLRARELPELSDEELADRSVIVDI